MFKLSNNLVLAATVFALTIASSPSYADDDDRKGRYHRDDGEYVVISIKTDPVYSDPEPACVALQMGMNLLSNTVPNSEMDSTHVTPAKKVVLFPTIGGVQLINPDNDLSANVCLTMGGMDSLHNLLEDFVDMGGEVVVCPLCATIRDITKPTYGTMGSGETIHNMFIGADKVIDF